VRGVHLVSAGGVATAPIVELLDLPAEYGRPEVTLTWEAVRARLVAAGHFWLVTVRPDGRPHVVPVDGIWLDDACFFGGSRETVKHRNLTHDPRAALHLEDAASAVIVEGTCEWLFPDAELAAGLAQASREKFGYAPEPSSYSRSGVWCLRPARVLSWQQFPRDATRFVFPSGR
jgi:nitroimidazol reductase NimA-like FMN-containing flavoprotein (pyridoxamine 5'-phosphate oxidase superfamily)